MEYPSHDRAGVPLATVALGPAVSPRRARGGTPRPPLLEALPPFVRPRRAASEMGPSDAAPEAVAAEAVVAEDVVAEAVALAPPAEPRPPEPEDGLGLVRGADWGLDDATDELELVDSAPGAAEPEPESPAAPALDARAPDATAESAFEAWAPEAHAEPAVEADVPEAPAGSDPDAPAAATPPAPPPVPPREPALAQAMNLQEGPAMEEVAGRLERIALALREGRPIELFAAGASDPLEVLIAGYALGYSEAFRRVNEERRGGR